MIHRSVIQISLFMLPAKYPSIQYTSRRKKMGSGLKFGPDTWKLDPD
jgi:hypothetical protein